MAIIKIRNAAIDLDAAEIPNIDAAKITSGSFADARIPNLATSKITSGTFADARIAASSVNQHATSFDDNKIINDISTLALRQSSNENKAAYNTNSMYVDVFQDATGITSLTNAIRDNNEFISTVSVSAGSYETGNRTSTYTITMPDITVVGGSVSKLVDGDYSTGNSSTSFYWSPGTNAGNDRINFDLGSGNSKVYVGARWIQDSTDTHGTWKWQGSNDNANFTDLSSNFTLGGSTSFQEQLWSNTNAFRYIHLRAVSGSRSNGSWNKEAEFKVATVTANATGSFESNAITASSSTSKMGAIITYQNNAGTNALNSDIVLKLSADGGSNYATATLVAMPDFATGIKMAKVNDLSVTSGTSLKYKIEFANQASGSKEARIRGVSLQY